MADNKPQKRAVSRAARPTAQKVPAKKGARKPTLQEIRARRRNRRVSTFLAVGLVAGIVVYFAVLRGEKTEPADAACVIVIDRTGSVNGEDERYQAEAKEAIKTCADRKAVTSLYYFDNQTAKLNSDPTIQQPFNLYLKKSDTPGETAADLKASAIRAADGAVDSIISVRAGHGRLTDIVSAMNLAAGQLNTMATQADVKHKYLMLLTDGIQNSGVVNMQPWGHILPQGAAQTALAAAQSANLIPAHSFSGIDITFFGVGNGTGSGNQRRPEVETAIHDFWSGAIQQGGGKLCNYLPSATTVPGMPEAC